MNEYKVGQVLYMIGKNTTKIMPIQVVEEVIRTTLDGKEKTYTIQLPDKKKTRADISEVKGILFKSTDKLKNHMIENATSAINMMLTESIKLADLAFDAIDTKRIQNNNDASSIVTELVQNPKKEDIIKVDLGDGKIGNVKKASLKNVGVK